MHLKNSWNFHDDQYLCKNVIDEYIDIKSSINVFNCQNIKIILIVHRWEHFVNYNLCIYCHMEIFKATIFYIYLIEDIYFNDLCIIYVLWFLYLYDWKYLLQIFIYGCDLYFIQLTHFKSILHFHTPWRRCHSYSDIEKIKQTLYSLECSKLENDIFGVTFLIKYLFWSLHLLSSSDILHCPQKSLL